MEAGTVNNYAVDYNTKIYAVAYDSSTIKIYNLSWDLIDTITIKNTDPIASLTFNSNNDLIVVTNTGAIFTLTQVPCPVDK